MFGSLPDFRFAIRALTRSPWFTALAVVTLALGIGANTAIFSLLDTVLLRALPYKDPDRLVEIWGQDGKRTGMRVPGAFLEALRERSVTIESIAIHGPVGGVLRTREGLVDIRGDRVSANFVEVMGVPPMAGRGFLPEEGNPGASAVMLVSYSFWQRYLGGDPEAVGLTLYMDGVPYTVIGIMTREFRTGFGRNSGKEFWTTYVNEQTRALELQAGYELIARLSPGVTLEESRREMAAIVTNVEVKGWGSDSRSLGMVPLKEEIVGDSARALKLLLAAVAVVLAIACANLAQLLFARADRRVGEFATRKAIGASSFQLFRLALMESLLLSIAGGVAAVALAYWFLPVILILAPSEIPRIAESTIDWRVLAASVGLSLVTCCLFGLAPALRLSRLSVAQALARVPGRFSSQSARFRSALVVGQVAASVTLFVLAALLGRTFLTLLPSNPGFEAKGRTAYMLYLPPKISDRSRFLEELLRRIEAIPGMTEVGLGSNIPFSGDHLDTPVRDLDNLDGTTVAKADPRAVSANYFRLLQIPLLRGRVFSSADGPMAHGVAIVNERLARSLAPGGDVLGRRVRIGASATQPPYQIVGVVADARSTGTSVEVLNEIYIPYTQRTGSINYLIVRSSLDNGALAGALGRGIRAAAPELPLSHTQTAMPMEELVRRSLTAPRFSAMLISAFSATALLLSAMGVFGLVAYSVSQRRQEFGIRAALGAGSWDLTVTAIRSAVVLTAVGVAFGLAAAAYVTRFVESQLYATKPFDPPTFIGAAAVMIVVAGLAAYIPARRAARIDPMTALRYD